MGKYAVTGAASGIGAAVAALLADQGHEVVKVDIRNADVNADLSSGEGRRQAIAAVRQLAADGLDGLVPCAGVGPATDPAALIARINYFGSVVLVEGLKDLLQKKSGSVVLISSNTAWMSAYPPEYLDALLRGDEEGALACAAILDGQTVYGGGKQALGRWLRRNSADYARAGIRMNAIAPGYTRTAMTAAGLADPQFRQAITDFVNTIPVGRPGEAADQAAAIGFLLSKAAGFIVGSVLFVDGGHDAMFRAEQF